eukprot:CAMPEP_0178407540 /NCGR_PEP_ID=MMETSP0689_2-20121128/19481_1 /TAXON_ID=160604 /ORGANISM="Amphidinium massartii, Strain CS-259" /LENGTH=757 /DNA_ID=CAMNT_0020028617 /DNA_START=128 /DNA_END=2398 /DNA_ORIENTATION=-
MSSDNGGAKDRDETPRDKDERAPLPRRRTKTTMWDQRTPPGGGVPVPLPAQTDPVTTPPAAAQPAPQVVPPPPPPAAAVVYSVPTPPPPPPAVVVPPPPAPTPVVPQQYALAAPHALEEVAPAALGYATAAAAAAAATVNAEAAGCAQQLQQQCLLQEQALHHIDFSAPLLASQISLEAVQHMTPHQQELLRQQLLMRYHQLQQLLQQAATAGGLEEPQEDGSAGALNGVGGSGVQHPVQTRKAPPPQLTEEERGKRRTELLDRLRDAMKKRKQVIQNNPQGRRRGVVVPPPSREATSSSDAAAAAAVAAAAPKQAVKPVFAANSWPDVSADLTALAPFNGSPFIEGPAPADGFEAFEEAKKSATSQRQHMPPPLSQKPKNLVRAAATTAAAAAPPPSAVNKEADAAKQQQPPPQPPVAASPVPRSACIGASGEGLEPPQPAQAAMPQPHPQPVVLQAASSESLAAPSWQQGAPDSRPMLAVNGSSFGVTHEEHLAAARAFGVNPPPAPVPLPRRSEAGEAEEFTERDLKRRKLDDPPEEMPERLHGNLWEKPRDQVGLKLISDHCADPSSWLYILQDESRRSYAGFLQCPFSDEDKLRFFEQVRDGTEWKRPVGPRGQMPRQTAWMVQKGCGCDYAYGQFRVEPQEFPSWMPDLMKSVMPHCGLTSQADWPNSCNLNLYDDGGASVGWHSDDEKLFQARHRDALIISLSLGVTRKFELRTNWPDEHETKIRKLSLGSGDLMTMEGMTQKHFQHRIP